MPRERRSLSIEIRKRIVERYGPFCFYCGKEGIVLEDRPYVVVEKMPRKKWINIYDGTYYLQHEAFHFDHRIPIKKGGNNQLGNIVISCPLCNRKKGAK